MTREDDLISRRIIKEQMLKYGFTAPDMTITEFVEDCLPSAQPERKNGKWEKAYYCSECNRITTFCTFYCPNCGASMKGE